MYTLFYNKQSKVIKVQKANKAMQSSIYTDEVKVFNDCYFLCKTKTPLIEKAKEIKEEWIAEIEEQLKKVKAIKL